MDFRAVTAYFDQMACTDAYTGVGAFMGQLGLYDDSKRDSETVQRRVISTAAGAAVPARRAVLAGGQVYMLGRGIPDEFMGSTSRVGHIAHQADGLATVQTLSQACLATAGFSAYAARSWTKDMAFSQQSSVLEPRYHIHFCDTEPVVENRIVTLGGTLHIVRAVNHGTAGMLVTTCDELRGTTPEAANITIGTYSAATETVTGSVVSTNVLRLRWQGLFAYGGGHAPSFEAGDIQVVVAKSVATIAPGATLALTDGTWKVVSAATLDDVWLCRANRHGRG